MAVPGPYATNNMIRKETKYNSHKNELKAKSESGNEVTGWGVWVLCWLELLNMEANAGITAVERLGGKGAELGADHRAPAFLSSVCVSSSSPASHQTLAELLAVASQEEVRTGSWRLHSTSLGYRGSAGVEVGDWEPGVKCDLHVPVQADGREEQALHTLKRDGPLLLIVDKKGQGFSI